MKMELIDGSETSAIINQTPENYPKGNLLQGGSNMTGTDLCVNNINQSLSYLNHLVYSVHGESLK